MKRLSLLILGAILLLKPYSAFAACTTENDSFSMTGITHIYKCDTKAEAPTSGFQAGDRLMTLDSGYFYATNSTTWVSYFTAAEKAKLAAIAAGATANDTDANLKNRANHTGTQAQSTVTNLTTDLAARPTVIQGSTGKSNAKFITKSGSVASGTVVFYLTDNGLVGGNALCTNIYEDSVNLFVSDSTASYQMSYAITNANKTFTVTANKLTTANILTGILGQGQGNGATVKMTLWCD